MNRLRLVLCFVLALAIHSGCAPGPNLPPPGSQVKGTVLMDGKPLPEGDIQFELPGAPPSMLKITKGAFAGDAPVGKNKVEVFIYVDGPPSRQDPSVPSKIVASPERYWGANTTLEATVNAGGNNEFKFDLTSK